MTDDTNELQRRLEQATAPRGAADDSWDPETTALRAGWLALGDLLDTAQPQDGPHWPAMPPAARRHPARWYPLAIAALALSALIAVAVAWQLRGLKVAPVTPSSQIAVERPRLSPSRSATNSSPTAARETTLAWDSSLDEAIERTGRVIRQVEEDQFALASASGQIHLQLQSLKNDIENNPL